MHYQMLMSVRLRELVMRMQSVTILLEVMIARATLDFLEMVLYAQVSSHY